MHSNASDGTFTSEQIIERAKNYRIGDIAFTDHDTVASVKTGQFSLFIYYVIIDTSLAHRQVYCLSVIFPLTACLAIFMLFYM